MKRFSFAHGAFIFILFAALLGSCKKEVTSPVQYAIPANLKMISSGYAAGAATKIEVYAATDLFTGYNKLYIALYDSVTNAHVTQSNISLSAYMGTSQQGIVENPSGTQANNGLFNGAAIFTMPGTGNNAWSLIIQVENMSSKSTGSFTSTLNVIQTSPARLYSLSQPDDSTSIFVCLVQPSTPQLGVNSFEVAMYKQTNGMAYTPVSGYDIMITAEMPSMADMNSPNNINPVYIGNGHYTGKVDFIMSGSWQINMGLVQNGIVIDSSHYFNLSL